MAHLQALGTITACPHSQHFQQHQHQQHQRWAAAAAAPPQRQHQAAAAAATGVCRRRQQQQQLHSWRARAEPQDRDFIPPPPMPPPPPPGAAYQQQQQQYASATPKFQELGWREIKERFIRPTYLPASFALGALTIGLRLGAANYTFAETPFEFLGTAVSTGVMFMALAWVLFDFGDEAPPSSPGGGLSSPPPQQQRRGSK